MLPGTTSINTRRVHNPVKPGYVQHPAGRFFRAFVPGLAMAPDALIHEPWRWDAGTGAAYPPSNVDHVTAARVARAARVEAWQACKNRR